MTEIVITGILSFIVGVLVASVGWLLSYSARLSRLETNMANLIKTVSEIKVVTFPCAEHMQIAKQVAVNTNRLDMLETETKHDRDAREKINS